MRFIHSCSTITSLLWIFCGATLLLVTTPITKLGYLATYSVNMTLIILGIVALVNRFRYRHHSRCVVCQVPVRPAVDDWMAMRHTTYCDRHTLGGAA